jgi:hypothetical protein
MGGTLVLVSIVLSAASCDGASPTDGIDGGQAIPVVAPSGEFSCVRSDRLFTARVGDTLTAGAPASGRGVSDRLSVRLVPRSRILEPINNSTALVAVDTGRTWIVRLLRNCADSVEAAITADTSTVDPISVSAPSRRRYAGPSGTSQNDGTMNRPWSLAHAFALTGAFRGGDTLQLLPGIYKGVYRSRLAGSRGNPVVIIGPDTGRAVIDGGLSVDGPDAKYVAFEITSSDPQRQTGIPGSSPAGLSRTADAIAINAPRVSLLGMRIYDLGNALFAGLLAEDLVLEGNIVYNNGWMGPDRGHGHGFYLQNRSPSKKRVVGNVLFHQFSTGVKISGSSTAWLDNVEVNDNISFDNGEPVADRFGWSENIFHQGGIGRSGNLWFRRNLMVHSNDLAVSFKLNMGTTTAGNTLEFSENIVQGRASIGVWQNVMVRGNTFAMPFADALRGRPMVESHAPIAGPPFVVDWNRNRYVVKTRTAWPLSGFVNGRWRDLPFTEWVSSTGLDRNGAQLLPGEVSDVVRVIPLPSLPGRGFVAHWSTGTPGTFNVDIRSIVRNGQRFEIRHVFSLDGPPLVAGVFSGQTITLSARSPVPPDPVGMPLSRTRVRKPPAVYLVLAR